MIDPSSSTILAEPCTCIEELNAELSAQNQQVSTDSWTNTRTGEELTTIAVRTEKINKKKRVKWVSVMPAYCPICGQRYQSEAAS